MSICTKRDIVSITYMTFVYQYFISICTNQSYCW